MVAEIVLVEATEIVGEMTAAVETTTTAAAAVEIRVIEMFGRDQVESLTPMDTAIRTDLKWKKITTQEIAHVGVKVTMQPRHE